MKHILTWLILGAILVLIITHPGGFAVDATSGGSVLDKTLSLESGAGTVTNAKGSKISYGGFTGVV